MSWQEGGIVFLALTPTPRVWVTTASSLLINAKSRSSKVFWGMHYYKASANLQALDLL